MDSPDDVLRKIAIQVYESGYNLCWIIASLICVAVKKDHKIEWIIVLLRCRFILYRERRKAVNEFF